MQSIGSKSVLIAFCVNSRSMAPGDAGRCRQICAPIAVALVLTLLLSVSPTPLLAQAPAPSSANTRVEKDLLGEKQVPADAYYGVQTARALENFQISGVPINHYPGFVEAWAIVKLAAARANTDVGAMKPERLAAIEKACAGRA